MTKHWTDEDLLNHLYGVGPENGHLGDCGACRERWLQLSQAKSALPQEDVDPFALVRQRQQILARIERGPAVLRLRWASALAAATALALGVWMYVPAPVGVQDLHNKPVVNSSDAQLLREVSQATEEYVPKAAAPMRELFSDTQ